jgi:hypothetical protein
MELKLKIPPLYQHACTQEPLIRYYEGLDSGTDHLSLKRRALCEQCLKQQRQVYCCAEHATLDQTALLQSSGYESIILRLQSPNYACHPVAEQRGFFEDGPIF